MDSLPEPIYITKMLLEKVMKQTALKNDFTFAELGNDTVSLVNSINDYIINNNCSKLSLDISHLNIIYASKVTILCSTFHWAKYPNGKISWTINSNEIKEIVKPLNLGNIRLINAQ